MFSITVKSQEGHAGIGESLRVYYFWDYYGSSYSRLGITESRNINFQKNVHSF